MENLKILVIGATGNQGGAVAESLLQRGHHVRAMVRNLNSDASNLLSDKGIELVTGNFDDITSLEESFTGMDLIFAMTTPFNGIQNEIKHGKNIIDAAENTGIKHFLFSSVANADLQTGIPHFDSKWEIEKYLKSTDLQWTVVGPVFFYENILFPWNLEAIRQGVFRQALPSDCKLQQISVDTIGEFCAYVLENFENYIGRRINIASDSITGMEIASSLSHIFGKSIQYEEQSLDEIRNQFADMAIMYEWFVTKGFSVDIDALKDEFKEIQWTSFDSWAKARNWNSL